MKLMIIYYALYFKRKSNLFAQKVSIFSKNRYNTPTL